MSVDYPLQDLAEVLRQTEAHFARLADHFDPPSPDISAAPLRRRQARLHDGDPDALSV